MKKIMLMGFLFIFLVLTANVYALDSDNDNVENTIDNCPLDYNPNQEDSAFCL